MSSLGANISALYNNTLNLYLSTAAPSDQASLEVQLRALSSKLQKLIDETLPVDDQKYKNAVTAVASANQAVQSAINDLNALANAIGQIAQAISMIAKLAAAV
jgi:hypothetical protein